MCKSLCYPDAELDLSYLEIPRMKRVIHLQVMLANRILSKGYYPWTDAYGTMRCPLCGDVIKGMAPGTAFCNDIECEFEGDYS